MRPNLLLPLLASSLLPGSLTPAAAQSSQTPVTVQASDRDAVFHVDGTSYKGVANFLWPIGSKHILEVKGAYQPVFDERTRLSFQGWADGKGLVTSNGELVFTITADPATPKFLASFIREHRIDLIFHPVTPLPDGKFLGTWPGTVTVDGQCLTFDRAVWAEHTKDVLILATPNPGYVFLGWDQGDGGSEGFARRFRLTSPLTLRGLFSMATRATFLTQPERLQVLVNRQRIQTSGLLDECELLTSPYDAPLTYPPPLQPVASSGLCAAHNLCPGTMDLRPGTEILLAAEANQVDARGVGWVFDSWELPGGIVEKKNNVLYRVPGPPAHVMPKARFVRAAQVEFRTSPRDLKLVVDGSETRVSLFFFGPNSTHKVSAPAEQTDAKGRRYRFTGWSNGGPAEQEVTVPADALEKPFGLTAAYELLGQLTLRSEPAGAVLQVNGAECRTPCTYDRPAGTALTLTAPAVRPVSEETRWDFRGWSDGAAAHRNFTFTDGVASLSARYELMHRLVVAADPPAGATFRIAPASADGFHTQGTRVTIDVEASPGFKFRRWDGVLAGTVSPGEVVMNAPALAVAKLEKAPYVPPTGVRSAAGETLDGTVAPGSVIEITGANLASEYEEAKTNPLPQALQGVTVTVNGWWLPVVSVAPESIRAQLPPDLPEGEHKALVTLLGQEPLEARLKAARNAPALFLQTDRDPPLAFATKEDGRLVTADNPARVGETITVWGVGFGPTNPAVLAGFKTPLNPPYPLADALELVAAGRTWPHTFAGAAPDQVGLSVVRFKVDAAMPRPGNLELFVRVNGKNSPAVRLPIQ
jgi:uncharacterized protein (TIGR03437 family)